MGQGSPDLGGSPHFFLFPHPYPKRITITFLAPQAPRALLLPLLFVSYIRFFQEFLFLPLNFSKTGLEPAAICPWSPDFAPSAQAVPSA